MAVCFHGKVYVSLIEKNKLCSKKIHKLRHFIDLRFKLFV